MNAALLCSPDGWLERCAAAMSRWSTYPPRLNLFLTATWERITVSPVARPWYRASRTGIRWDVGLCICDELPATIDGSPWRVGQLVGTT